jgi:hypothetical protein
MLTEEWNAPALFSKENLGQVFYNSTSDAFKVTQQSVPAGTWASGGSLNTARDGMYEWSRNTNCRTSVGGEEMDLEQLSR